MLKIFFVPTEKWIVTFIIKKKTWKIHFNLIARLSDFFGILWPSPRLDLPSPPPPKEKTDYGLPNLPNHVPIIIAPVRVIGACFGKNCNVACHCSNFIIHSFNVNLTGFASQFFYTWVLFVYFILCLHGHSGASFP